MKVFRSEFLRLTWLEMGKVTGRMLVPWTRTELEGGGLPGGSPHGGGDGWPCGLARGVKVEIYR